MEHVVDLECRADELRLNPTIWQHSSVQKKHVSAVFFFFFLERFDVGST